MTYVYTCGNLHFSIRGRWEEEPFLGAELVEAGSGLYTQGFQFPTPMQEELEFCEKLLQTCFSTPTDDSMIGETRWLLSPSSWEPQASCLPLTHEALSQRREGPCWCRARACQPVSAQPPGWVLKKALAPWVPPLRHSQSTPLLVCTPLFQERCSSSSACFTATFVTSPAECLGWGRGAQSGGLGSQAGNSSGRTLGKIKVLLSKVRSHCLSSSQRLWRGSVWDTRPSLCTPPPAPHL